MKSYLPTRDGDAFVLPEDAARVLAHITRLSGECIYSVQFKRLMHTWGVQPMAVLYSGLEWLSENGLIEPLPEDFPAIHVLVSLRIQIVR